MERVKLVRCFQRQHGSAQSKLLGPAPLLPGEDEAAYEQLLAEAAGVIRPADLVEQIWLTDYVYETWELRQVRQAQQGLVTTSLTRALRGRLLASSDLDEKRVDALTKQWRAGEAEAIEQIEQILSDANLTFEDVHAQAFRDQLDGIERLYRLMAVIEARRNAVLREIERRRICFAQRLRENSDYLEATELDRCPKPVAGPNNAPAEIGDDER